MYVCHCNGLTEQDVRRVAGQASIDCPYAVYAQLGCAVQCGMCVPVAADIVRDAAMQPARMIFAAE